MVGWFAFRRKGSQVLFAAPNRIAPGLKPEYCNIMLSVPKPFLMEAERIRILDFPH